MQTGGYSTKDIITLWLHYVATNRPTTAYHVSQHLASLGTEFVQVSCILYTLVTSRETLMTLFM